MNILVIEPHPQFGGGMEGFALSMSRELSRRGHRVVLAYETPGTMLAAYEQFVESAVQLDLPGFPMRQPARTMKQLLRLARLIRNEGITTIFSSHLGFLSVAAALRPMTGAKAWFHLGLPANGSRLITRLSLRFLGGGISPSPHTKDTWAAAGWPTQRLHEVRNYVDPLTFRPADDKSALRAQLGLPKDRALIGYIGRMVPEKGVESLVDAFNLLAPDVANVDLILLGRGDPSYIVSLSTKCQYPDRLRILPATARASDYWAVFDIGCVPSTGNEPFGLTLIEAMASGLAVVCSDVGIFREIIGRENADLVTPAGDSHALAGAMLRLLRLGDLGAARGHLLRNRAIEFFGPDDVVDAYERIMTQRAARSDRTSGAVIRNCPLF